MAVNTDTLWVSFGTFHFQSVDTRLLGTVTTVRQQPFNDLPHLPRGAWQVLASGDLVVWCLEPSDAGLYTCTVYNTLKPYLFDRVHTWLIMSKGAAAATHHQVLLPRIAVNFKQRITSVLLLMNTYFFSFLYFYYCGHF